jgi:hypothetical protein
MTDRSQHRTIPTHTAAVWGLQLSGLLHEVASWSTVHPDVQDYRKDDLVMGLRRALRALEALSQNTHYTNWGLGLANLLTSLGLEDPHNPAIDYTLTDAGLRALDTAANERDIA